jgi:hypothetical protein
MILNFDKYISNIMNFNYFYDICKRTFYKIHSPYYLILSNEDNVNYKIDEKRIKYENMYNFVKNNKKQNQKIRKSFINYNNKNGSVFDDFDEETTTFENIKNLFQKNPKVENTNTDKPKLSKAELIKFDFDNSDDTVVLHKEEILDDLWKFNFNEVTRMPHSIIFVSGFTSEGSDHALEWSKFISNKEYANCFFYEWEASTRSGILLNLTTKIYKGAL